MKNLIKVERARQNLSQAELAEKTNVSRQTITSIEIGRYVPSALLAFKIAVVLQIKADELFTLEETDWES